LSQKTLPLSLKPLIMRCDTFTDGNGDMDSRTIIVVPTRFEFIGNAWKVKWQCSRGGSCHNKECFYCLPQNKRGESF